MARTGWKPLVVAIGFASASAPGLAVVDQYNLYSLGESQVEPTHSLGQDFHVGVSGLLTGIEIAPLLGTSDPSDQIILILFDQSTSFSRGNVSISAGNFQSDAPLPVPLSLETTGPGYFDVSSLGVKVSVGDLFRFDLRHGTPAGICDLDTFTCTEGLVGSICFQDSDCDDKSFRIGTTPGSYYGPGVMYNNGQYDANSDLTFKTFVDPAPCLDEFDQANLTSNGNLGISNSQTLSQFVGQTFTVGVEGALTGIEIAPLFLMSLPTAELTLELFDSLDQSRGSATISAATFPSGVGNIPDPLSPCETGPGFFDISSLGVNVSVGEQFYFVLSHSALPGVCDPLAQMCIQGLVGALCVMDMQCDQVIGAGTSADTYVGGTALLNDSPYPADLAFKTFVDDTPCSADVDQYNLTPVGGSYVDPDYVIGQSFTVGAAGLLTGIEISPRLYNSDANDQITLELFDAAEASLGTVSISPVNFPKEWASPGPLLLCHPGPGYFDTSGLGVTVSVGEQFVFQIRHDAQPGICDPNLFICTQGTFGDSCIDDYGCDKAILVGHSDDTYVGGNALVNGAPYPFAKDLVFKTFVPEPGATVSLLSGAALLSWLGRRRRST